MPHKMIQCRKRHTENKTRKMTLKTHHRKKEGKNNQTKTLNDKNSSFTLYILINRQIADNPTKYT